MHSAGARAVLWFAVAFLTVLQLSNEKLVAQINSATITGSIFDSSRAAIPGASVTVTNEDTHVSKAVASGESGEYAVPYLAPGRYTVTVGKSGLSTYRQTGIALGSGQTARVDAELRAGTIESSA